MFVNADPDGLAELRIALPLNLHQQIGHPSQQFTFLFRGHDPFNGLHVNKWHAMLLSI